MKKVVYVTGCLGFIGSYVTRKCLERGWYVKGVDKSKLDALQATVQKIRADNLEKDRLIKEYEKTIQDIQKFQENKQAVYLSGSNLNKTL